MKNLAVILVCCLGSSIALAKPVGSGPSPEQSRQCESIVNLCDRVAGQDYNNCVKVTPRSNCSGNYIEDIDQCTTDYNDCMGGGKAHAKVDSVFSGAAGGAVLSSGG